MDFKDLSLFKKILVIVFLILISPLLLIIGSFILIKIPFEYPRYRFSYYYKKYKQKYHFGITSADSYKIINYLEKNKIKYDKYNPENDELVINNITYLFPWFEYISYNEDGDCIIAEQDNYEPTLLSEDKKIKNRKDVKLLINKNDFKELNLKKANEKIILYNKLSDLKKEFEWYEKTNIKIWW